MKPDVPTIFIILGVTGDLAQRKLFPALWSMHEKNVLPARMKIVGFSRRDFSDDDFKHFAGSAIEKKHGNGGTALDSFLSFFSYSQGLFESLDAYNDLALHLEKIDKEFGQCTNKLFYLAVPPTMYELIFKNLARSGLNKPCGDKTGWTRILVEKPFGNDEQMAEKLDRLLGSLFEEEQIFRIDHYLAKETMQNILSFRFSNAIFQSIWSAEHIESVRVRLFEKNTAEGRGVYEGLGALRDVGQNHMLQMLALVSMETPKTFDAQNIRAERAKVLKHLNPMRPQQAPLRAVRAQYEGFKKEPNVSGDSKTETFFALKTFVHNKRWKGVPFYLESGKAMRESKAEIEVRFREASACEMFNSDMCHYNTLTFHIQPNEGISVLFWAKKPGFDLKLEPRQLSFKYNEGEESIPDAYEKVLYDCIRGDQTLFASTEEVKAQWSFISSVLRSWQNIPLLSYKKGSVGPDGWQKKIY